MKPLQDLNDYGRRDYMDDNIYTANCLDCKLSESLAQGIGQPADTDAPGAAQAAVPEPAGAESYDARPVQRQTALPQRVKLKNLINPDNPEVDLSTAPVPPSVRYSQPAMSTCSGNLTRTAPTSS